MITSSWQTKVAGDRRKSALLPLRRFYSSLVGSIALPLHLHPQTTLEPCTEQVRPYSG